LASQILAYLRPVLFFGQALLFFLVNAALQIFREFHTARLPGFGFFPDVSLSGCPVLSLSAFDGLKIAFVFVPGSTKESAKR
jgi:hypothetical protein